MAGDEEKAVWEDNPQTVFEKYEAGEASAEDYIKSLSLCDVTEFAKQSHNFVKVYTHYKEQSENSASTPGEIKAAEQYMMVLESIYRDKSEEFEQLQQPQAQNKQTPTTTLDDNSAEVVDESDAFGKDLNADFAAFGREADDGFVTFDKQAREEYEDNSQQVRQDYEESSQQIAEDYEESSRQVEQDYQESSQQIAAEHEAYNRQIEAEVEEFNRQKAAEEQKFLEEMQQYQQNPYTIQDYSAKVDDLGLENSTVLNFSKSTRRRSLNGMTYTRNSQTEFRQADNGFALMQDNQIRTVTVDGNNNPHFQISENGQTRDMTKEEADAFLHDLDENKNGKLLGQFNDELLSTIEAAGTAGITPEATRDEIIQDYAEHMERPWTQAQTQSVEPENFEEEDMSPEKVAAMEKEAATFSSLQQAGQRVMDNVDLNAGETVDLASSEGLQADPNTFSALQQAGQRVMDNVDLNAGETITLNPPANAASARAKMDKVMDDAAQAFAGIPGVKLERGTVDISNGEFKFTPREAPAAEQAAPTAPAAPTAEQEAPAAPATPTVEGHEAEAVSPDIAEMAKKIQYMNTVNNAEEGSLKYIDPQKTAQKMHDLYGENASTLLNEAIMAPNDVNSHADGAITSRAQTYSREAVDYLANLSPQQAKEYADRVLSPAELGPDKSPQEKLQDGLADLKANNPEQYGDLTSAVSQLANGGNLEDALMQLVIQMMKQAGYADTPEGQQAFTQDAQTAIQQIEHSENLEKARAGVEIPTVEGVALTKENADPMQIKPIELDSYGYLKGSAEAQKHDEDMKTYRELYKNDPKKFKKAKEGYEKAAKSGEMTGQAKYNLDVINTVEKEEKLKEQMLKDQEKAAKQIKKLEKKIEKAKSKGNDEKAKALQEELDKLMKEQGLKKEDEGKDGKAGKEAKDGKDGKGGKEGKEGKEAKAGEAKDGKDGQTAAGQPKDTPVTETEYAESTQNGFKITKGNEVRTVTFENGGRVMHFAVNDQPMTQDQANQFMKDLQQAPNLDQEKVSLTLMQKNINEMSGTMAYAPPKTEKGKGNEPEREIGTQDNTLSLNTLVAMQKGGNSMG